MITEILSIVFGALLAIFGLVFTFFGKRIENDKKIHKYESTLRAIDLLSEKKLIKPEDICEAVHQLIKETLNDESK
jgi:hypothetical protein